MEADSLLMTLLDQDMETQDPGNEVLSTQEPNIEQTQSPNKTQTQTQSQSQSILSPPVDAPSGKKQKTNRGKGRQRSNPTPPPPATPGPPTAQTDSGTKGKGKGRKRRRSESEDKSENDCIVSAINRLTDQIGGLSKRIERLESSLDSKIAKHVQKALNPAIDKIKEDFNAELKKVRDEMKLLKENQTNQQQENTSQDTYLNIVIRNLPESANENTNTKVNSFLKEALKIDVVLENIQRKPARNELENGVIVATCKTRDDKSRIMKAKSLLRYSRNFRNVYIEHDLPRKDRNTMSNFRTLANVIGSDKVFVRGNKLLVRDTYSDKNDTDNGEWQQVRYRRQHHDNHRRDTRRQYDNQENRPRYHRNDSEYRTPTQGGGDRQNYRQERQQPDRDSHDNRYHNYQRNRHNDQPRYNTYRRQRD